MNEKDIVVFPQGRITQIGNEPSRIRAKSFKVTAGPQNYTQYVSTVTAYALAGMSFEHIANAGDHLGDLVERGEIDASLQQTSQSKAGEIAKDENQIMAWQNRGERISIVNQLPSAQPIKETEIVPVSNNTSNVLEGIAVFNNQPQQLSGSGNNSQLEANPYLRVPADLKRAA